MKADSIASAPVQEEQVATEPTQSADSVATEPKQEEKQSIKEEVVALKNNLLYDAAATPNLELEIKLAPKWSLELGVGFNPFPLDDTKFPKWRHIAAWIAPRYWFCNVFNRGFVSANVAYAHYNVAGNAYPVSWMYKEVKEGRYQGDAIMAGISGGWHFPITPHFSIELEGGVDAGYTWYQQYECKHCGDKTDEGGRWLVLPKLAVNLVVPLGGDKESLARRCDCEKLETAAEAAEEAAEEVAEEVAEEAAEQTEEEQQPTEAQAQEQPAEEQTAEEQVRPTEEQEQPAEEKQTAEEAQPAKQKQAAEEQTAEDKQAAEEKPAEEKAAEEEHAAQPVAEQAQEQPAEDKQAAEQAQPAKQKQAAEEQATEDKQPAEEQPAEEKAAEKEHAAQPVAEQAQEQPAEDKQAAEQAQPAKQKQGAEEQTAEEQPAEEKTAEEEHATQPVVVPVAAEKESAEEKQTAEEQAAEEKPAEEKAAEEEQSAQPVVVPVAAEKESAEEEQTAAEEETTATEQAPKKQGKWNPLLCPSSEYAPFDPNVPLSLNSHNAFVHFEVDVTRMDTDFFQNARVMNDVMEAIDEALRDSTIRITCIRIVGLASFDGGMAHNIYLAKNRAATIKKCIQNGFPTLDEKIFEVINGGESWTELQYRLERSDFEAKDEVLDVIKNEEDADARERKIKALHGGETYRNLRDGQRQILRNLGCITIYCELVE